MDKHRDFAMVFGGKDFFSMIASLIEMVRMTGKELIGLKTAAVICINNYL